MNTPKQRKGFTFYRSFHDTIKQLPKEEQLSVYNLIMDYALDLKEPDLESLGPFANIVWTAFKPNLEADRRRYENGCKGGAPKGSINNPQGNNQFSNKEDNQEDNQRQSNENENENENVDANANENDNGQRPLSCDAPTAKRFSPPTISEIENYIQKQGYTDIDASSFADYYTSIGWQVGNVPMRDWKAALRRWHTRNKQNNNNLKTTKNERQHHSTNPQNSPRLFRNLSDDEYLLDAQPRINFTASDNSREG